MQEEVRNCGCNNSCGCGYNNGGFLNGLFGKSGCDSEILYFIIVFLLLCTDILDNFFCDDTAWIWIVLIILLLFNFDDGCCC